MTRILQGDLCLEKAYKTRYAIKLATTTPTAFEINDCCELDTYELHGCSFPSDDDSLIYRNLYLYSAGDRLSYVLSS